jgi:hypothetical protein
MANSIHLIPKEDRWALKKENSSKIVMTFDTKEEAEREGRRIAKEEELEFVIHNKDGKISDSDSYGSDPRSSKDTVH